MPSRATVEVLDPPDRSSPDLGSSRPIHYPTEDETELPGTTKHARKGHAARSTIEYRFKSDPRALVAGDILLFYRTGNNRRHVSPDVFFVRGVPAGDRPNYLLWEEGVAPQFVLEVVSESTVDRDRGKKKTLYQDILKVEEYFLVDPEGTLLTPRLQGFRLVEGKYAPIDPVQGRLRSEILGADIVEESEELHFYDSVTGERWLTPTEAEAVRADREAVRAEQASAQVRQASAQARQESERADREAAARGEAEQRALREAARADQEAQARADLEARLREALQRLEGQDRLRD